MCPQGVHFIPGHPIAGTEHSGPESGFAELFDGRWCVLTPPAGADAAAVDKLTAFWEALRHARRDHGRRRTTTWCWPSPATCRISSPTTSSIRPAPGARDRHRGDQVLGRRLSRLHAHRRLRSGDVARRVPQQQGGGAGDAGPLQRGSDRAAARHPLRRRRDAVQLFVEARAIRRGIIAGRPGYGGARLRPHAPAGQPDPAARKSGTRK